MPEIDDNATVRGIITTRVWDVSELEDADPEWSDRPKGERHELLRDPSSYPTAPMSETVTKNIPVDGYLEAMAAGDNPQPNYLAIGDGTTAPDGANTSLNNEVYRTNVGSDEQSGRDRITSTFLSQNEANGHAIREIGFTDAQQGDNWTLLTHAVLDSTDQIDEKTSATAVTFNYVLSWQRVS